MDKIKKYVGQFYKKIEMSRDYDLKKKEWITLAEYAKGGGAVDAVGLSFLYGYAKGYRAAMAEIKKGGAA